MSTGQDADEFAGAGNFGLKDGEQLSATGDKAADLKGQYSWALFHWCVMLS